MALLKHSQTLNRYNFSKSKYYRKVFNTPFKSFKIHTKVSKELKAFNTKLNKPPAKKVVEIPKKSATQIPIQRNKVTNDVIYRQIVIKSTRRTNETKENFKIFHFRIQQKNHFLLCFV